MPPWAKEVAAADLVPEKLYFFAVRKTGLLYCADINGKTILAGKPGIAIRLTGAKLVELLAKHKDHMALEIPADADTRWKRRKKRLFK